jgi:phytanoyl-CoA dioxygenase PhyH
VETYGAIARLVIGFVLVAGCAWAALRVIRRAGRTLGAKLLGAELPPGPAPSPGPSPRLALARERSYWRELCPQLRIEADPEPVEALEPGPAELERMAEDLGSDGYSQISNVLSPAETDRLAAAVEKLRAEGWPPVFGFVFDEFWRPFARLRPVLAASLGAAYRHLPELWAWHLDPRRSEPGWKPHRDKGSRSLLPDGRPKSLTVWIALTEATPLNGCIYVLPATRDPNYRIEAASLELRDLQDIRALPVPAGTALVWSQALLHWGGRASPQAPAPRISLSCEFQRGDVPPLEEPLFDASRPPSFELRLRLVALQVLQYAHMHALPPGLVELARAIQG